MNGEKNMSTNTNAGHDMPTKFGQLLMLSNLITEDQLNRALKYQERRGGKLGEILQILGYISTEEVTHTLGMKYSVPTVNLANTQVDREILKLIPQEIAWANRIIPIGYLGSALACAMEDPTLVDTIELVEFRIGRPIQPVLVTDEMMTGALNKYYPPVDGSDLKLRTPVLKRNKWKEISKIVQRLQMLSPEQLTKVQLQLDKICE
jgi:type IV pilus assembly protein PilB